MARMRSRPPLFPGGGPAHAQCVGGHAECVAASLRLGLKQFPLQVGAVRPEHARIPLQDAVEIQAALHHHQLVLSEQRRRPQPDVQRRPHEQHKKHPQQEGHPARAQDHPRSLNVLNVAHPETLSARPDAAGAKYTPGPAAERAHLRQSSAALGCPSVQRAHGSSTRTVRAGSAAAGTGAPRPLQTPGCPVRGAAPHLPRAACTRSRHPAVSSHPCLPPTPDGSGGRYFSAAFAAAATRSISRRNCPATPGSWTMSMFSSFRFSALSLKL